MAKDRQLFYILSSHSFSDLFTKPDRLTKGLTCMFYT